MSDELNVWREASDAASENAVKWKPSAEQAAAAVIRTYGDKRYQQAIADVVEWLQQELPYDVVSGMVARRFGKDA